MSDNIFSKKDKTDEKIILREGVKSSSPLSTLLAGFKKYSDKPKEIKTPVVEIKKEVIVPKKEKEIVVKKVKSVVSEKNTDKIDNFSNPKILEMDLISDQIEISFDWKKNLSILGVFVLITLVLVGEIYLTLFLWQKNEIYSKTEKLKSEAQSINQEIQNNQAKAADALVLKNKLEVITPILAKHVYWTNFFTYLQTSTLADVFYSGFSGGVDGNYALKAFVKDFRAIGVQLKAFLAGDKTNSASISNERINNSGKSVGVMFDLNLSVKNDLFNK